MAEEEIASYSWRLPLDEWSPLCDNILKLDRSSGLAGSPMKLNRLGICPPPCEMCVTAIDPGGCDPETAYSEPGTGIQRLTLTVCDVVPSGKSYLFQFSGGGVPFQYDVLTAVSGEDFVSELSAAMLAHVQNQGGDGFWEAVAVNGHGLTISIDYGVELTGQLSLSIVDAN